MGTYSATGITLLTHKFKGTERVAVFYTLERGKVEALVSGVGKPASKLAPAVEPLTLSRLFLAEGRTLDRLTQCEVLDTFYDLRKDLQRLALASYCAELVAQTTEPGLAEPGAFEALRQTLAAMEFTSQPDLITWAFVVKYLHLHGLGPVLEACVACGAQPVAGTRYVAALGGCVCADCATAGDAGVLLAPPARSAMQTMAQMEPARLDRLRLDAGTLGQVREILRRHLRHHVGITLKSETFLEKLARTAAHSHQSPRPADG